MKIKNVIIFVLVLAGLGGLMWWGKPTGTFTRPISESSSAVSALTTAEKLYDFGTISMANKEVSKIFKVTNPIAEDIKLESVVTSCMCTTAYLESASGEKGPFGMAGMGFVPLANEIIKAGESREIKVVYDPNAHGPAGIGPVDRFIYLTDTSGRTLELEIKAVVTP